MTLEHFRGAAVRVTRLAALACAIGIGSPCAAARITKGTISHPGSNQPGDQTEFFGVSFTATTADIVVLVAASGVLNPCHCLEVSGGFSDIVCSPPDDQPAHWHCRVSGLTPGAPYHVGFTGTWHRGTSVTVTFIVLEDICPGTLPPQPVSRLEPRR